MRRVIIGADTTTKLSRTTVHDQYNGEALGFFMLNHLVPIVLNVRQPGGYYKKVILVWRKVSQRDVPYRDLGIARKCCRKVFIFNTQHYVQCYLPATMGSNGSPTQPYTFNFCQKCGVGIKDDNGHMIGYTAKRFYRRNRYIYKAKNRLQDDGNQSNTPYQERVQTNEKC